MSDISRVEQLLRNALGEDIYEVTPQSRVEELLQQLNEVIEDMGASVDPTVIEQIVTDWLEENIHDGSAAVVDSSLTIAGAAADAKKTGDELSSVKEDLTTLASKEDAYKAFPTDTASGAVASFADGANVPVKSLVVNIDPVQEGSGAPSPDNVRPISGWSEVNVNACGINAWDEEWEIGAISDTTGKNTTNNTRIRSVNYIPVIPNAQYYPKKGDSPSTVFVFWYNAEKKYLRYESQSWSYIVKTIPSDAYYMRFTCVGTTYNHDISINYPSTDHDYHEGHVQSINIALGQTVYGGKLDVIKGELVIDRTMVDLGTLSWTKATTQKGKWRFGVDVSGIVRNNSGSAVPNIPCEVYAAISPNDTYTGVTGISNNVSSSSLFICDLSISEVADLKTVINGKKVVYPLAAPLTIQLTPHEVTALLGSNNVWTDTGDSTVEYRADPTLYIRRLTEPDADMIADANIVSGQYFMVGNTLYKATANIASGATISPNVNCTRKSLSEALNEINS